MPPFPLDISMQIKNMPKIVAPALLHGAVRSKGAYLAQKEFKMSLRTTVEGSWWPLPEHEADLERYHADQLFAEEGEEVLNRAATAAIAEQRALGLDEW